MSDLVVGVLFFAVLIVGAVLLGGRMQGSAARRNRSALAALSGILPGEIDADHKSGTLTGMRAGKPVWVRITPNLNIGESSDSMIKANLLEIVIREVSGRISWELRKEGLLRKEWRAASTDPQLQEALTRSGLAGRLDSTGKRMLLRFDSIRSELLLQEDVGPRRAPGQTQLEESLALLDEALALHAATSPA